MEQPNLDPPKVTLTRTRMPNNHLLSPGRIGSLALRNRVVMSPMGVAIIDDDGVMREPAIRYYEERARGGAGLIITEPCAACYPRGAQSKRQPGVSDDKFIPGLRDLTDRVHQHGAAIAMQLVHHGKVSRLDTREGRPLLMPSKPKFHGAMDMAKDLTQEELGMLMQASKGKPVVQPASIADIKALVADFADAAVRAAEAGFDAIELHAAHGYILSEFLSPAWNRRQDEYGGSVENRARLLCEAIHTVKDRLGAAFPVWCRIDAVEYRTPNGLTLEHAQRNAELAVEAGADAIHVSAYADATSAPGFTEAPLVHRPAGFTDFAAKIKSRIEVPVIAVGRIEATVADTLIRDNKADFVAMARKMLADPEIASKLSEGRDAEIRPCIYCYSCVAKPFFDRTVHCGINPAMGRELQWADAERSKTSEPKHVLIVGGGVAGLEAARVAAVRGHRVTLLERSSHLGGRLRFAAELYEPNRGLLNWLIARVEASPIDIRLETQADRKAIEQIAPDVVLIASGAEPSPLQIPGADLPHVINGYDQGAIVTPQRKLSSAIGDRVVVIGDDQVALRLAEFVQRHGRTVTLLGSGDTLAPSMAHPLRWRVLNDLREAGATLNAKATVREVSAHSVTFDQTMHDGTTTTSQIELDTAIVANALGAPNAQLGRYPPFLLLGDAGGGGTIESAIYDGFTTAAKL